MRTKIYILAASLLVFAVSASAHPLGNFSVNQFSRLEIERFQIKIRQVLDLAEIPTFQLASEIDLDGDQQFSESELNAYSKKIVPAYVEKLALTINENPSEIRVVSKMISVQNGAGNLPTLRLEMDLVSDLPKLGETNNVRFDNTNNLDRIGWNEIVLKQIGNMKIFNSNGFGSSITNELQEYPEAGVTAPLLERAAAFSISNQSIPENSEKLQNRDGHISAPVQKDKLAELIAVPEITPSIAFFGLLLAIGLGAMHAMSPGHGKTVVGAYLVGSRGTFRHAIFLGATVTITHTLGVFALGLITLFASNFILPERLMPFLGFVSGLMVFYIGFTMFKSRLYKYLGWEKDKHHHYHEGHSHGRVDSHHHAEGDFTHSHDGHSHSHLLPDHISWKSLLGLGISGGLLPCPSALVLMLSAINLGRIGYGLILTTAFSFGLAATLSGVGLIFLYGGKLFDGSRFKEGRLIKLLPVASSFVIACLGALICYNSYLNQ